MWTITMDDAGDCTAVALPGPGDAVAIECPPGMSQRTRPTVAELQDKSCVVLPANVRAACPLPPGEQLAAKFTEVLVVEKRDGKCHVEEAVDCPPGKDCNPPSPKFVPCPPGVDDTHEKAWGKLRDGTCRELPDGCRTLACAGAVAACPD